MNHREKLRWARKNTTPEEAKSHTPPFQTKAWLLRKSQIEQRVIEEQTKK